jgi:hypothetical protein
MKTFQAAHLSAGDVAKMKNLSEGKFDDTVLYKLLSALSVSFDTYNPDNTVMIYLKQHSQVLRWEHKFNFRNPKEKEKDKDNSNHKSGEASSKQKDRSLTRSERQIRSQVIY